MPIPSPTEQAILARVRRDLEPPAARVHARLAASVGLGGLVSLFLCGQFGIGMTAAASFVHGAIMAQTGTLGCAAVCGILFALVPVVALRALSGAMLFRVIVSRHFAAAAAWMAGCGALLAGVGRGVVFGQELVAWIAAAVAALFAYSRLLDRGTIASWHAS
jgi:hypothetical protein